MEPQRLFLELHSLSLHFLLNDLVQCRGRINRVKGDRPLAENSRPEIPGSKIYTSCQRDTGGSHGLVSSHHSDLFLDAPLKCGSPSGPDFRTSAFSQSLTQERRFSASSTHSPPAAHPRVFPRRRLGTTHAPCGGHYSSPSSSRQSFLSCGPHAGQAHDTACGVSPGGHPEPWAHQLPS